MFQIRIATIADLPVLAEALLKLANHHRHVCDSPYSQGLPKNLYQTSELASRFVEREACIALIAERAGQFSACLLAEIGSTSMPSSGITKVGHIQFAWVEASARNAGMLSTLVAETEKWFAAKGIQIVELAFMTGNEIAAEAWSKLGYQPFRKFSYKKI